MSKIIKCDFCEQEIEGARINQMIDGECKTSFMLDGRSSLIKIYALDSNHDRKKLDVCNACLAKGGIDLLNIKGV